MAGLKILYGYPYFASETYQDVEQWCLQQIDIYRKAGFDVEGFCLTLDPPGPRITYADLDARWRLGERKLFRMYENLEEKLSNKDVFINSTGINLHPKFVEKLNAFTVYQCYDDPESSEDLSKPVACSYDLCLVGNIAEVETYRSWGVKKAAWIPQELQPGYYDPNKSFQDIQQSERDIDIGMLIDRTAPWRRERVEALYKAFPGGSFYGKGWPMGFLPYNKEMEFLNRVKIGPNIHNSTGPINFRTFYLPANGVMQICDNKSYLGQIFELGKEVVGFDNIQECIDLCRYYLAHDRERREIAAAGYLRAIKDYNEVAVFTRTIKLIEENISPKPRVIETGLVSKNQFKRTRKLQFLYPLTRIPNKLKYTTPEKIIRKCLSFLGINLAAKV